ncbi:MAG: ABC-F family ATP-binding cassette domain-containing protein [Ignavibacteriales bacterium]
MILLQANRIYKSFGVKQVLTGASLVIGENERVGMVGPNGCGKSTFLKCITNQISPDAGEVSAASNKTVGYLEQLADIPAEATAWDAVMDGFSELLEQRRMLVELTKAMADAGPDLEQIMDKYARVNEAYERANGYACETMGRRVMVGLGFSPDQFEQSWSTFSGGEKTRLNLARLLLLRPDILLLDEPTNHLDVTSVEWLEEFLITYRGSLLVVSHDRRFLDRVANRMVELRNGEIRSYPGNYTNFLKLRAEEDLAASRAYERQQEYIRRTEEYITKYRAGIKSKQARGRQSQLDRLERVQVVQDARTLSLSSVNFSKESGNMVFRADSVSKAFGNNRVLQNIDVEIEKGDRLALVGPNGSGKTTFLKILVGEMNPDTGGTTLGSRVKIAYFGQERNDLNPAKTVLEELLNSSNLTNEEARTRLGGMLFRGDDVFKRVGDLSGGEQSRLALLKMIVAGGNFLVLDEPTNHLDIDSCQAVEDMLTQFSGTLLIVSHDRYFLDQIVDEILAIEDGDLVCYQGNYSYYQQKREEKRKAQDEAARANNSREYKPRISEEEKEQKRRKRELLHRISVLEETIEALEIRKSALEGFLSDPETYNDEEHAKSTTNDYRQVNQELSDAYDEWEELLELLPSEPEAFGQV